KQVRSITFGGCTLSQVFGICGRRPMASSHKLMRIMGGSDVLPGTWPWMVSIQTKVRGNIYFPSCGGSLIGPQWVLSAVHCFQKPNHPPFGMSPGLGPETEQRFIKRLVKHEKYDNQLNQGEVVFADIALLEMDEPVNCSDYIQPACLPDERMEVLTLGHCYVSGWGGLLPKGESNLVKRRRTGSPEVFEINSSPAPSLPAGISQGGLGLVCTSAGLKACPHVCFLGMALRVFHPLVRRPAVYLHSHPDAFCSQIPPLLTSCKKGRRLSTLESNVGCGGAGGFLHRTSVPDTKKEPFQSAG
uniref:Peptidase S1 domain-containing protein n=1 Tax=Podarcis muralis TaxID=64176 RepID=A0A670JF40_PODMU